MKSLLSRPILGLFLLAPSLLAEGPLPGQYIPERFGKPGFEATGDSKSFCSKFPALCTRLGNALPWLGGASCRWTSYEWSTSLGEKYGGCSWHCEDGPTFSEPYHSPHGVGPNLAFLNVREGDDFSGRILLQGFAMDFSGVSSIELYWNGQRIVPEGLYTGLASEEACSPPLGILHFHCRRDSGFQAQIDTTVLPNGPGILALVALDTKGWASSLEYAVSISNKYRREAPAPAPPPINRWRDSFSFGPPCTPFTQRNP